MMSRFKPVLVKITAYPSDGSEATVFSAELDKDRIVLLNKYAGELADECEVENGTTHTD